MQRIPSIRSSSGCIPMTVQTERERRVLPSSQTFSHPENSCVIRPRPMGRTGEARRRSRRGLRQVRQFEQSPG